MMKIQPLGDSKFLEITPDMEEGRDYISLSTLSKSPLGRSLALGYNRKMNTVIGEVKSIRRFMEYVSTRNYPTKYLLQSKLKSSDIREIARLDTLTLPNYWGILAYITCKRVKEDKRVTELLKENTLPLTIVQWVEPDKEFKKLEGNKLCLANVDKLAMYLAIIRDIEMYNKANLFYGENITELVEFYKKEKDLSLFEGSSLILKDKDL